MMDEAKIKEAIDVIFQKESDNFAAGIFYEYVIDFPGGPFNCSRERFLTPHPLQFDKYANTGSKEPIKWETYSTLKQLFNKIESNPESRLIFINHVRRKIFDKDSLKNINVESTQLAFYFLMKIGGIEECIQAITDVFKPDYEKDDDDEMFANMLKGTKIVKHLFNDIYIFISMESSYFDSVLAKLQTIIKATSSFKEVTSGAGSKFTPIHDRLSVKVNSLRYEKIKLGLTGINEEINIDKEQVIDLMTKYGFPPEMESFLLELDKIPESEDWSSINSGMINSLRAFFESLIKNISAQIEQKTGGSYLTDTNPKNGEMGRKREYIRKYLKLSEKDDKFITAFVDILHKEGGHAFMSEKRYFVLSKNIGIELTLFLMSKLGSFLSDEQ